MTCSEFRERYSDLRDATVTAPRELKRLRRHLAACAPCRAYDAAVRSGVAALRDVPEIAPSAGFRARLEARLAREAARRPRPATLVRIAAALLVAVALSLVVREAVRRPAAPTAPALPPVAFPKPVAHTGVPLVTFQDPRAGLTAGNPSPYGTALVQPAVNVEPATAGR